MISSLLAVTPTILVPLLACLLPGVFLVYTRDVKNVLSYGVKVFLWSITTGILVTYAVAAMHLSLAWAAAIILIISGLAAWRNRHYLFNVITFWYALGIILPVVLLLGIFSISFLNVHNGLPTGDSQKAIIWANAIIQTNALPDYSLSETLLNRDPVDFYTPGLHSFIALIMLYSPLPLTSVGFISILLAIIGAFLGAAIGKEVFDKKTEIFPSLLTGLLILTNFRYLRYVREPGYHLQNIMGEVLLFGLLFLGLSLINRWKITDAVLFALCLVALLFSHQFSTFIAVFALLPAGAIFLYQKHKPFIVSLKKNIWLMATLAFSAVVTIGGAVYLQLYKKIPDIFTLQPHLMDLLPSANEYATLMGPVWMVLGLAGLILLIVHALRGHHNSQEAWGFIGATVILLLLSQGPRIFIDIPPVRALFYAVIPLSISAAYIIAQTFRYISLWDSQSARLSLKATFGMLIVAAMWNSTASAFTSLSHTVRTNSTLTPGEEFLIQAIDGEKGAVLVDDYNRRSASWFVLSGKPMFTRIAADLKRQMEESAQSPQRYALYLAQLDFEKIFSLGSLPEISELMRKHDIATVTGIHSSSQAAFMRNSSLSYLASGDDISLYSLNDDNSSYVPGKLLPWLLRASTLANDIGDDEDTYLHLPASITTANISAPKYSKETTYRISTAPIISLKFNIGSYVKVLWDKEHTAIPDTAAQLYVRFADNIPDLTIKTSTGKEYTISSKETIVKIPATEVPIEEDGYITIQIKNPQQLPINFDVIALGLAQTP